MNIAPGTPSDLSLEVPSLVVPSTLTASSSARFPPLSSSHSSSQPTTNPSKRAKPPRSIEQPMFDSGPRYQGYHQRPPGFDSRRRDDRRPHFRERDHRRSYRQTRYDRYSGENHERAGSKFGFGYGQGREEVRHRYTDDPGPGARGYHREGRDSKYWTYDPRYQQREHTERPMDRPRADHSGAHFDHGRTDPDHRRPPPMDHSHRVLHHSHASHSALTSSDLSPSAPGQSTGPIGAPIQPPGFSADCLRQPPMRMNDHHQRLGDFDEKVAEPMLPPMQSDPLSSELDKLTVAVPPLPEPKESLDVMSIRKAIAKHGSEVQNETNRFNHSICAAIENFQALRNELRNALERLDSLETAYRKGFEERKEIAAELKGKLGCISEFRDEELMMHVHRDRVSDLFKECVQTCELFAASKERSEQRKANPVTLERECQGKRTIDGNARGLPPLKPLICEEKTSVNAESRVVEIECLMDLSFGLPTHLSIYVSLDDIPGLHQHMLMDVQEIVADESKDGESQMLTVHIPGLIQALDQNHGTTFNISVRSENDFGVSPWSVFSLQVHIAEYPSEPGRKKMSGTHWSHRVQHERLVRELEGEVEELERQCVSYKKQVLALKPEFDGGMTLKQRGLQLDRVSTVFSVSRILEGHRRGVIDADFTADDQRVVSVSRDGRVISWNPSSAGIEGVISSVSHFVTCASVLRSAPGLGTSAKVCLGSTQGHLYVHQIDDHDFDWGKPPKVHVPHPMAPTRIRLVKSSSNPIMSGLSSDGRRRSRTLAANVSKLSNQRRRQSEQGALVSDLLSRSVELRVKRVMSDDDRVNEDKMVDVRKLDSPSSDDDETSTNSNGTITGVTEAMEDSSGHKKSPLTAGVEAMEIIVDRDRKYGKHGPFLGSGPLSTGQSQSLDERFIAEVSGNDTGSGMGLTVASTAIPSRPHSSSMLFMKSSLVEAMRTASRSVISSSAASVASGGVSRPPGGGLTAVRSSTDVAMYQSGATPLGGSIDPSHEAVTRLERRDSSESFPKHLNVRIKAAHVRSDNGDPATVNGVDWRDDTSVVSCGSDTTWKLWDLNRPEECVVQCPPHSFTKDVSCIRCVNQKYTSGGIRDCVLAGSVDQTVQVFDLRASPHKFRSFFKPKDGEVTAVEWLPNGMCFAAATTQSGMIHLYDLRSNRELTRLEIPRGIAEPGSNVTGLSFSVSGRMMFASLSLSPFCAVFDVLNSQMISRLYHSDCVESVRVSKSGRQVCTASLDSFVRLWRPT